MRVRTEDDARLSALPPCRALHGSRPRMAGLSVRSLTDMDHPQKSPDEICLKSGLSKNEDANTQTTENSILLSRLFVKRSAVPDILHPSSATVACAPLPGCGSSSCVPTAPF